MEMLQGKKSYPKLSTVRKIDHASFNLDPPPFDALSTALPRPSTVPKIDNASFNFEPPFAVLSIS